ncbi:MFS transporter [Gorillibacterium sp. sgz500922]|uniref:MFS transporter n=1 Tax=Gorillibacterium sp. sgz500922 TaxID=3446694 RepID=UPI003F67B40C
MEKNRDLVALSSIPLTMTLGNSMLLPILPQISRELGISAFQVSMIITVYGVVAIFMIPVAGYLSDRFGRKKVILPSLLLAAMGGAVSLAAAWLMKGAGAYGVILAGRFLQGIGAAGAFPVVIPLIGDLFEDEKQVSKGLGIIETSNTFGKVLSPIIGAALGAWLWFAPFIAIPVLCILSFVLVAFLVRKPKNKKQEDPVPFRQFLSGIGQILKEKGRWLYAIFVIGGISMFMTFGVLFYLSEILESDFRLHGVLKGLVLAIPLTLLCFASFVGGKVIGQNKRRMKWLGFGGMVLVTAALILVCLTKPIIWIMVYLSLCGIGIGSALPCMDALITEGIEKENRGTITSLYSSMRFIGVALGPPVVSLLLPMGQRLLFGILAAVGALGGLLIAFSVRPSKGKEKPGQEWAPLKKAKGERAGAR